MYYLWLHQGYEKILMMLFARSRLISGLAIIITAIDTLFVTQVVSVPTPLNRDS